MYISDPHEQHEPSVWATLYALGELEAKDRAFFERHLDAGCPNCRSQLHAFARIMARLAVDVSWEPPSPISPQLVDQTDREHAPSKLEHNAILLFKAGLLITRSEALPWEPGAIPGVFSKSLYVDSKKKYSTVLVRMEARAVYPAHKHNDIEEVFVLEGDLFVDGVHMVPGDYCRSEPGSIHAATTTESGALLLVSASQEDEIFV